jgi:hypothetical protein
MPRRNFTTANVAGNWFSSTTKQIFRRVYPATRVLDVPQYGQELESAIRVLGAVDTKPVARMVEPKWFRGMC